MTHYLLSVLLLLTLVSGPDLRDAEPNGIAREVEGRICNQEQNDKPCLAVEQ